MRSKRTQELSSVVTEKSAQNGRETRDQTTLLPSERALGVNRDLFLIRDDDGRPTHSFRRTEDITERKHAERAIKIVPTIVLAGLGALAVLTTLGLLEHFFERVVSEVVALSVPVIFGSITAAGITYFALRRQEAFYRRTLEERELAENAQREAERKYRDIFENAVEGIFQTTPNGEFITANPSLARMLVFASPEELIRERTDIGRTHYVELERRVEFKRLLDQHDTVRGFEFEAYRKDGTKIWMSDNVRAVRDASGKLLYYEGTVEDITERKRVEEALRKSEERYRELFENDKDAIYVHDLNGVYTSVNRAAESLSGYSREEILGKHFRDFVSPEYLRQVGECFGKKLEETGETNYEVEIINRDGARVPVEISSRLIYENGVAVGVQGSVRDITERKRAQQALLTYSRRLLEAQEAERGRIARELHDQIGQMLTALKLNLHAMQGAGDAGEARPLIEDNLKMLDEALEQVHDLSIDLRPLLLDDLGLVTALRWFVDHQAQRTGVRAEFTSDSLDPDLRFSSELETACFRIAQEALTNVARHARAKTVTVRLSRNRDYLILLVEDDGAGFEIEALQGHALATLGLRGMQERAHAVGGRIKIDSATDRGTQVFVELPIAMSNGRKPQLQNE
jgi:PAS domain S-box-containing protein